MYCSLNQAESIITDVLKCTKDAENGIPLINTSKSNSASEETKTTQKRNRFLPPDIEQWVARDFVAFTKHLYCRRYGKNWNLNFAGQCKEVLQVKDSILERMGFCDNKVMKDFIVYFFDHQADRFMQNNPMFYIRHMRTDQVLDGFISQYKYKDDLSNLTVETLENQNFTVRSLGYEKMRNLYLLDGDNFVCEYGIILSILWLIAEKKYTLKSAIRMIYLICLRLKSKNRLKEVILSTEKYNPYPANLLFLKGDLLLKKIDSNESVNIKTGIGDLSLVKWLPKAS